MQPHVLQTIVAALATGVACHAVGKRLGIPPILFYLLAGTALGPAGADLIHPAALERGLPVLVEFSMAVILFEGGLTLSSTGFSTAPGAIRRLLTLTIAITFAGAAALAHFLLGLDAPLCLLFAAIMVVTGPTVIGPLLKSVNLGRRLESLLHWESIWGDVIGVLLAAVALQVVGAGVEARAGLLDLGASLGASFGLSLGTGGAVGALCGLLLRKHVLPWAARIGDAGLPGIIALAAAPGVFELSNTLAPSSGPLAAAVAGYFLTRLKGPVLHSVRHFKDQLAVVLISTMFVLLAASLDPRPLAHLWPRMLLLAALLAFVVRPVAVTAALWRTCPSMAERAYLGLIGPRGIIALATAAYASLRLPEHAAQMDVLLNATFAIVLFTGAFATVAGGPLARLLKLSQPDTACGIVFVGSNEFSHALADAVAAHVPVVFFDASAKSCALLRDKGYETMCTDELDDEMFEEALQEGFCRVLALTSNGAFNELLAEKAARHFGPGRVHRAKAATADAPPLAEERGSELAFAEDFCVQRALERQRSGEWTVRTLTLFGASVAPGPDVIPLLRVLPGGRGVRILAPGSALPEADYICLAPPL
ncbi:MAG: sodium:proton antiporter [Desulfovibrionaceae bacterium]|jgi:NhaP-type Na+/H+ or K+/H+ antiporter/uncharacterized protein with PIN domain|nr:sodium:proton antiporter [Desulfovibrionaceae bacterium]